MLVEVLKENEVSTPNIREVLLNVESAKHAIFTPGPDELVSKEVRVVAHDTRTRIHARTSGHVFDADLLRHTRCGRHARVHLTRSTRHVPTRQEMMAEAASLDGDVVARLGGPEVGRTD